MLLSSSLHLFNTLVKYEWSCLNKKCPHLRSQLGDGGEEHRHDLSAGESQFRIRKHLFVLWAANTDVCLQKSKSERSRMFPDSKKKKKSDI